MILLHVEITLAWYGAVPRAKEESMISSSQVLILRCWMEPQGEKGAAHWRFRLENPASGEQRSFVDVAGLVTFLQEQYGRRPPGESAEGTNSSII
jgi:hypothetical protein